MGIEVNLYYTLIIAALTQDSIDTATVQLNETQSISSTLASLGSSINDSLLSRVDTMANRLKLACQGASILNSALDDLCDTIPTELGSSLNIGGVSFVCLYNYNYIYLCTVHIRPLTLCYNCEIHMYTGYKIV